MLFVWPMVSWQLWRRLDPARALIWTVLGGYLIMPPLTVINFPIIPDLDKTTIPNLIAWCGALYVARDKVSFLPEGRIGKALILMYILSPFATVLTNTQPLYFQAGSVQGMKIYDSAAAVANQFIALVAVLSGAAVSWHARGDARGNRGAGAGGAVVFGADADRGPVLAADERLGLRVFPA